MNISKHEQSLLNTKAFKYLNSQELGIIKGYCNIITFKKGELLFTQGKKNSGMYILLKGNALIVAKILGKNMLNLATLEEGNFYGQVSLIQKTSCAATVIANTEVQCLELTTEYFDTLALFYPDIRYKITKAITEEACEYLKNSYKNILNTIKKIKMTNDLVPKEVLTKNSEVTSELISFNKANLHKMDLFEATFFKGYAEDEINLLIQNSDLIKVSKNYILNNKAEDQTAYYIIIRGAVQLSIFHQKKKAKLAVLSPISIFGCAANILNESDIIHYISCERAILLRISHKQLKIIEESNKLLWYKFSNSVCESFVALERAADKLTIRLNSELYNR